MIELRHEQTGTAPARWPALLQWACLALTLIAGTAVGSTWNNELANGQSIAVDPSSNRVIIQSGQASGRQLWDGVHRLRDGSIITIRSGVMVPNEQSMAQPGTPQPLQAGEPQAPRTAPQHSNACDHLALKTCGLHGECGAAESCYLARQLLSLQRRSVSSDPAQSDWAIAQCQGALQDEQHFRSCAASSRVLAAPCDYLAARVCGKGQRCANSDACRMALQLLQLERQQAADGGPGAAGQCRQMLLEHAFFPPCR